MRRAAGQAAAAVSTLHRRGPADDYLGTYRGATVIDDYGHHPTEIRATLQALREQYQPRRLFCCFQPHQYSRTRLLLAEFATCFADADDVILTDIYRCRDKRRGPARPSTPRCWSSRSAPMARMPCIFREFPAIVDYLKARVGRGDLVLTIGAGNIWEIGKELVDLNVP